MTVPIVLNKTVISSIASLAFYELGLKPILYVNILDHIYRWNAYHFFFIFPMVIYSNTKREI